MAAGHDGSGGRSCGESASVSCTAGGALRRRAARLRGRGEARRARRGARPAGRRRERGAEIPGGGERRHRCGRVRRGGGAAGGQRRRGRRGALGRGRQPAHGARLRRRPRRGPGAQHQARDARDLRAGDHRGDGRHRPQALDLQRHRCAARLPHPRPGGRGRCFRRARRRWSSCRRWSGRRSTASSVTCTCRTGTRRWSCSRRGRQATESHPSSCSTSAGAPKTRPPLPARGGEHLAAAAGLGNQQARRRHVPGVEAEIDHRAHAAPQHLGVAEGVGVAPQQRELARHPVEGRALAVEVEGERIAVRDDRPAQIRLLRHARQRRRCGGSRRRASRGSARPAPGSRSGRPAARRPRPARSAS